jgi:hypothetical protein
MFFNKKGLSAVVATISLVLLTVVAVSIVVGIVLPFVRENLEEGSRCVDYRDYFEFEEEFGFNCYRISGSDYLYGISVGADTVSDAVQKNVAGFKLSFIKEGNAKVVDVFSENATGSGIGEIRMLNLNLPSIEVPISGEVRTYVYHDTEAFGAVEISPVLKGNRVCEKTDSIRVEGRICESALE